MKNFIILVLVGVAIGLGALAVHQKGQLAQSQAQVAEAEKQLAERVEADKQAAQKIERAERKSEILQDTLAETSKYANEKAKQAEQLKHSLAGTKTNKNENPMAGFSKMFKDPAMKEMIKAQQKTVMGPMIDKQYAAFFQQLSLTPEQTASLKDLLQKKALAGTEAGMSMMDGSLDATQRADVAKQVKSEQDKYEQQIKEFLGDDNFKNFQDYEKTAPDRMALNQFNDQVAGGANALNPDQQAQLVQAMSEERNAFKWTTDLSNKNPPNGDFASMFTEDKVTKYAEEKERLDQQVVNRAQQILTPDQLAQFQQFQKTQRDMQMLGMKMAAKMFAPKGD